MITQKELKELLYYDPISGVFTWLKPKQGRKKSGSVGGGSAGYIEIHINGRKYQAHRLAWLYIYGVWPEHQIDHINHIVSDNAIGNLREATHQENGRNQSLNSRNTSGVCGVSWDNVYEKWLSQIGVNGRAINLGRFHDKFEAICARKSANNKFGFHENHGVNDCA